jgi:cation transport ATPase
LRDARVLKDVPLFNISGRSISSNASRSFPGIVVRVLYLMKQVGINEIHAEQAQTKTGVVRQETAVAKTLYIGDGINDTPAMMAATVGMAVGQNTDVTAEAAGRYGDGKFIKEVDEFLHISRRMRSIATLQSAVRAEYLLSLGGMIFAAGGYLVPVAGAISQEIIDVHTVLSALRAAFPPKVISDMAEDLTKPSRRVVE